MSLEAVTKIPSLDSVPADCIDSEDVPYFSTSP